MGGKRRNSGIGVHFIFAHTHSTQGTATTIITYLEKSWKVRTYRRPYCTDGRGWKKGGDDDEGLSSGRTLIVSILHNSLYFRRRGVFPGRQLFLVIVLFLYS